MQRAEEGEGSGAVRRIAGAGRHLPQVGRRGGRVAEAQPQPRAADPHVRSIGVERERAVVVDQRFVVPSQAVERDRQVDVRVDVFGRQRHGPTQVRDPLLAGRATREQGAQVVVRLVVLRVELHHSPVELDRLGHPTARGQHRRQRAERGAVAGRLVDRHAVPARRLVGAAGGERARAAGHGVGAADGEGAQPLHQRIGERHLPGTALRQVSARLLVASQLAIGERQLVVHGPGGGLQLQRARQALDRLAVVAREAGDLPEPVVCGRAVGVPGQRALVQRPGAAQVLAAELDPRQAQERGLVGGREIERAGEVAGGVVESAVLLVRDSQVVRPPRIVRRARLRPREGRRGRRAQRVDQAGGAQLAVGFGEEARFGARRAQLLHASPQRAELLAHGRVDAGQIQRRQSQRRRIGRGRIDRPGCELSGCELSGCESERRRGVRAGQKERVADPQRRRASSAAPCRRTRRRARRWAPHSAGSPFASTRAPEPRRRVW